MPDGSKPLSKCVLNRKELWKESMMRKGFRQVFVPLLISAVLGYGAFVLAYRTNLEAQVPAFGPGTVPDSTFTPYLAHAATTYFDRKGNELEVTHETHARRGDGSIVHIFNLKSPAGEYSQARKLKDFRSQREVVLEPFTKSATSYYLSDKQVYNLRRVQSLSCASLFPQMEETNIRIMGMRATRVVDEGRGFRIESLVSAELGCLVLKDTAVHPSGARSETVINQLTVGEPPEEMFQLPADFVERSPEQVEHEYRLMFPGNKLFGDVALKGMEQRYFDSRKK
jgi:hypothetical protein